MAEVASAAYKTRLFAYLLRCSAVKPRCDCDSVAATTVVAAQAAPGPEREFFDTYFEGLRKIGWLDFS